MSFSRLVLDEGKEGWAEKDEEVEEVMETDFDN